MSFAAFGPDILHLSSHGLEVKILHEYSAGDTKLIEEFSEDAKWRHVVKEFDPRLSKGFGKR